MIAQRLKLSGMLRGCYRHRNPTLSGSKWALGRSLEVAPHSDERGVTPLPATVSHTRCRYSSALVQTDKDSSIIPRSPRLLSGCGPHNQITKSPHPCWRHLMGPTFLSHT